jgi:hypothetical protein
MADYIRTPFADAGDKTVIPQTDGAGAVNFNEGYPVRYSEDPSGSGLSLLRPDMNYLFWVISQAIQQYQQHGVPDFIETSQNGGAAFSYDEGAMVLRGGVIYRSLSGSNVTAPPGASWLEIDPYNELVANASPAFTGLPTAPTQPANTNNTTLATTEYADRAGLTTFSTTPQEWDTSTKLYTFAHPLGAAPKIAQLIFTCTTADAGYSVGDRVVLSTSQSSEQSSADYGYATKAGSANIYLSIDTNHSMLIHEWNDQSSVVPADASWDLHYELIG